MDNKTSKTKLNEVTTNSQDLIIPVGLQLLVGAGILMGFGYDEIDLACYI